MASKLQKKDNEEPRSLQISLYVTPPSHLETTSDAAASSSRLLSLPRAPAERAAQSMGPVAAATNRDRAESEAGVPVQVKWALLYLCIATLAILAAGFYVLASGQTQHSLLPLGWLPNDTSDFDGTTTLHSAGRGGRHDEEASSSAQPSYMITARENVAAVKATNEDEGAQFGGSSSSYLYSTTPARDSYSRTAVNRLTRLRS
ncbi:uncharacterized protein LOC125946463 [Dermacentor silvarum]|uniref:uncharacterized protein LOC125946463 n=1 Tax=Dermacentor silvarum TaxID=543639 RepID=UPI0021013BFD|nr:uncharacterized protein LOC125946463 [Dermacentor silvarum]